MIIGYKNKWGRGNALVANFVKHAGGGISWSNGGWRPETTMAVIWGIMTDPEWLGGGTMILEAQKANVPFYHIDRAYFKAWARPNRLRITFNSIMAGPTIIERPADRWKELKMTIEPWRKSKGPYIVVCPPSEHMCRLFGDEARNWLDNTLATLKQCTKRPIIVRHKAEKRSEDSNRPFTEDLMMAHAVIGFNSNTLVEAAVAGVPIFATKHSAAYPVALDDISKVDQPYYPENRQEWCNHLAYCQFTRHEIKDGSAWKMLNESQVMVNG